MKESFIDIFPYKENLCNVFEPVFKVDLDNVL